MTAHQAIEIINEALQKCLDDGWRFKGRLEAAFPQTQAVSETTISYEKGILRQPTGQLGEIRLEFFNIIAKLEKKMTKQDAAAILETLAIAENSDIEKVTGTGDVCKYCGGVEFRRMGTCLYCLNCGESNGCS